MARRRLRPQSHGKLEPAGPRPAAEWKRRIRQRALFWFARHARDLPWRRSRDPYRIWVSEVMLQQTQVATVRPYFERFLAEYPTVAQLAAADEEAVLRLWEGLGYYRRARQLHEAARRVVDRHQGEIPTDAAVLRSLPGVGRYTAGAILSIAHDQRQPIVEANTSRLLCRLLGYRGDPASAGGQGWLWSVAEELLPRRRAGQFNQALMEIGAALCKPRQPRCQACPLSVLCAARREGLVEAIPPPKPRPAPTELREAAVVVRRRGQVLMHRYGDGRRWAGLWDFVRFEIGGRSESARRKEIVARVEELTGAIVALDGRLATLQHGVTRYRITLDCHLATYLSGRLPRAGGAVWKWFAVGQIDRLPLCTTGRTIAGKIRPPAPEAPGRAPKLTAGPPPPRGNG